VPNTEFLEKYPLYRRFVFEVAWILSAIEKVPVHMRCGVCKADQTFCMTNEYFEGFPASNTPSDDAVVHLRYRCMACVADSRHFYVKIGPKRQWIMKVGQFPAWDVVPEKELETALGAQAAIYSHGLICESQGYGIGAFAYYRRVVENVIDALLDDVLSLIPVGDQATYSAALKKTKSTKVAQEKIDLVKDLLPPILRPDGMNPLGLLHDSLSRGMHAETDEACLSQGAEVREILVYLLRQVSATKRGGKQFTESMRRLLEKRSERPS